MPTTVSDSTLPPEPVNVEVIPDTKAIIIDWDPPMDAYITGSEIPDADVAYYQVQIASSLTFPAFSTAPKKKKDRHVVSTKKRFTDVDLATTWYARVRSVSHSGTTSNWITNMDTGGNGAPIAPAPVPTSDGNPPPQVTAAPSLLGGIGSLTVQWVGVVNADPTNYEIHLSTQSGFATSASTLVSTIGGSNTGGTMTYLLNKSAAGGGLSYGTTYYARIIARDLDGAATASPPSTGVSPLQATATDVTTTGGAITDKVAPSSNPATITVIGGPTFLYVKWTAVTNNDPVGYRVYVSATSGFTPATANLVGETSGTTMIVAKLADGTALAYGTIYYAKVIAFDADGASTATVNQGSGSMVKIATIDIAALAITATEIKDDAITTPKIAANAVTANEITAQTITSSEIATNTITASQIAADTITANEIATFNLSAISGNIGSITSGSITSTTVTGGTFRTDAGADRIQMTGVTNYHLIAFYRTGSTNYGQVGSGAGSMHLHPPYATSRPTVQMYSDTSTFTQQIYMDSNLEAQGSIKEFSTLLSSRYAPLSHNHSGGAHGHGDFTQPGNHSHGMQHNHGGQTGLNFTSGTGHRHNIDQLTSTNTDPSGDHGHNFTVQTSGGHSH